MNKTKLSKSERQQVEGLLLLAKNHMDEVKAIERAIASILRVPAEYGDYYGHVSDAVYCGYTASELLNHLHMQNKLKEK